HDGVDALWFVGDQAGSVMVEKASIGNLKQVWTNLGKDLNWSDSEKFDGDYFLQKATQVKNVWIPYGA
ncbi:Aldehyde dehydrogenase, partial [hydrothermal vent metagenome]